MIDGIPQWFQVRVLVDHRGAQISVTHDVAHERWILCLCHRVRAESMSSVVQNNLLGNPSSRPRRAELTRNSCEMAFCRAPGRKHPFASVRGTKPASWSLSRWGLVFAASETETLPKLAAPLSFVSQGENGRGVEKVHFRKNLLQKWATRYLYAAENTIDGTSLCDHFSGSLRASISAHM